MNRSWPVIGFFACLLAVLDLRFGLISSAIPPCPVFDQEPDLHSLNHPKQLNAGRFYRIEFDSNGNISVAEVQ